VAGADLPDRSCIDQLRLESQVRTIARRLLYRDYPRWPRRRLSSRSCERHGATEHRSDADRGRGRRHGRCHNRGADAEARLCSHIALIDVAGDPARAMALDTALAAAARPDTTPRGESRRRLRADVVGSQPAARASPGRAALTC
jgi:hypothetical protein